MNIFINTHMNEAQAQFLASFDYNYVAKRSKSACGWFVWCQVSDHVVEFNLNLEAAASFKARAS